MGIIVEKLCRQYIKEMGIEFIGPWPHRNGWISTCDGCILCANKLITMFNWSRHPRNPGLYDSLWPKRR